jgi:hypothetical protein
VLYLAPALEGTLQLITQNSIKVEIAVKSEPQISKLTTHELDNLGSSSMSSSCRRDDPATPHPWSRPREREQLTSSGELLPWDLVLVQLVIHSYASCSGGSSWLILFYFPPPPASRTSLVTGSPSLRVPKCFIVSTLPLLEAAMFAVYASCGGRSRN